MNSWKESPHLFANGKFRIKYEDLEKTLQMGGGTNEYYNFYDANLKMGLAVDIKDCTLIARPISDMSDEEVFKLFEIAPIGYPDDFDVELDNEKDKEFVRENCKYLTDGFLYLLSIGCYPFDQNHNDIIWRRENDNEE